eukprot:TRINITY_DN7701_c0_g2_i1.p1 TRINITY_DN7701_c0_g2~~TRINITY_DN7701_c0_g2_i1.p1  ORF type:complete len:573 (+),score=121.47 TRINITY_DN7701_c0_g2_i1:156-1874(+)
MELKKLVLPGNTADWRKLGKQNGMTLFASIFAVTLIACSLFLAFSDPRSGSFLSFLLPSGPLRNGSPTSASKETNGPLGFQPALSNADSGQLKNGSSPPDPAFALDFSKVRPAFESSKNEGSNMTSAENSKEKKKKASDGSQKLKHNGRGFKATDPRQVQSASQKPLEAGKNNGRRNGSVEVKPNAELKGSYNGSSLAKQEVKDSGLLANGTSEVVQKNKQNCDLFLGKWVPDDTRPLYAAGSCPYIDESFNCFRNRRPDNLYERWRWQPNDCDIPRLNATDMLERLRNKRLAFVGDSLNRNMWESLVCILRDSVSNKSRVYEVSGKKQFRTEGFYAFRYEDYNCSIEFVRAPFLVQEWEVDEGNGTKKETLRLDLIESSFPKVKGADVVIFNTGHWWTHEKTSKGHDYYQEGDHVYPELNVLEAYRKALKTWSNWVDSNLDMNKTTAFFRGYSATHFSGGQWNSGGQCHKEVEPIFNDSYITKYPPKMHVLESVLNEMKNKVLYLNITRMTDYRKDAHPSIYRREYLSQEERIKSVRYQDCSHWCLPGVPDIWNELVYASLLMTGKGSWKT